MSAAEELVDSATNVEIDRELSRRSLLNYIRAAWHLVEPSRPFLANWHIEAICEHLEAVKAGEITRLVINIPPVCMKSLTTCVFWPTWAWTDRPQTKWIYASYSAGLSRRDALRSRRVLESDWYRRRWGDSFESRSGDEWTATKYANDRGGFRLSTSVAGMVTGDHADVQVVDDPLKPQDALGSAQTSRTALEKAWVWWNETMSTRLVDFEKSSRVIIMQRLHEDDLAGRVLKDAGYDHLCLPMEFDPATKVVSSLGFEDPRREPDELLWPSRFARPDVDRLKRELGSLGSAAQLQQIPSPRGGSIFKREWLRYYYRPGFEHLRSDLCEPLPEGFDQEIQAWDLSFKGGDSGSHVGGAVLGKKGSNTYVLDRVCERLDFADTCSAVEAWATKWPKAIAKLIEDAANGPAVFSALKNRIPGIVLVKPGGGKEARANAVSPILEAGNFYLPHPEMVPWAGALEANLLAFPSGSVDDDVDAVTHGLVRLHLSDSERYVQAMKALRRR